MNSIFVVGASSLVAYGLTYATLHLQRLLRQETNEVPHRLSQKPKQTLFLMFLAALVAAAAIAILIVGVKTYSLAGERLTDLGQKGDFFGGTLNPVLTFVTFVAFLYTLFLQRTELQESRVQFKRTADANYQSSFFQLLSIHNDIVEGISVLDPVTKDTKYGRDAFRVIYSNIRREYRDKRKKNTRASEDRVMAAAYGAVYRDLQGQLGHYFRFLYNSIILLESAPDSEKYIKLLRAQLSNQELLVLFYNCAASEAGKNFGTVARKHRLFDNMPPHLLSDHHARGLDEAFGPGGYESLKARSRGVSAGRLLNPPLRSKPGRSAQRET